MLFGGSCKYEDASKVLRTLQKGSLPWGIVSYQVAHLIGLEQHKPQKLLSIYVYLEEDFTSNCILTTCLHE